MLEGIEKIDTVLVILKDGLLFIAARRDVIHRAGVFYAEGTGHGLKIARAPEIVNSKDLTL